jgi:RNA methyltransferase, TrmH family
MTERITSLANPRIKRIRKLSDRKERKREGVFLAEGLRIVIEAIQLNQPIETLIVSPELLRSETGMEYLQEFSSSHPDRVLEVSADVFRSFSGKDGPQGIAAVIAPQELSLDQVHPSGRERWVALDEIADPGNLGTILRTADAAGAQGIILLDECTDPYDPAALRASMGAVFSLGIVKASFTEFKDWVEKTQVHVVGTSDKAKQDYHTAEYPTPLVLLMGSERQGLDPQHFELCEQVVSIPMNGRSDSLNLAVATGIMLYEIYNHITTI